MFNWNRHNPRPRSVADNVQHYMAGATFPDLHFSSSAPRMPPEGHKSQRNRLTVRLERYRRLGQMNRLKTVRLDAEARRFIEKHVPSEPLDEDDVDPDTGECVYLPCEGYDIASTRPPPLRRIEELGVSWLENLPLRTVERLIHMIPEYDEAKSWNFISGDSARDVDENIFRYYIWKDTAPDAARIGKISSLIVAYQPPFILAPRDLEQFVQTKSIPNFNELAGMDQERLTSSQKVWAKIWDICRENNCHYFVLTNYMQWVFGGFSHGWKHGFTSSITEAYPREEADRRALSSESRSDKSRSPNVIEHLLHWVISSMGCADAYALPSVPEPVEYYFMDAALTPKQSHFPRGVRTAFTVHSASVSDCNEECQEDTPGSAGLDFELDTPRASPVPYVDDQWVAHPSHSPVAMRDSASYIAHWQKGFAAHQRRRRTAPFSPIALLADAPSPVMSDWSDESVDTMMDGTNNIPQGTFNLDPPCIEDNYAAVSDFD